MPRCWCKKALKKFKKREKTIKNAKTLYICNVSEKSM